MEADPSEEVLRGELARIIYYNDANAFTVALLDTEEGSVKLVGELPLVRVGERLRVHGYYERDDRYGGRQLRVRHFVPELPDDAEGIQGYLASGAVKGVGKVLAKRIVETFGAETAEVIAREPERLGEVRGLGKKIQGRLFEEFRRHSDLRDVMVFLRAQGIPIGHARRIHAAYGEDTINQLRKDPYKLVTLRGFGFRSADRIALELGLPSDAPARLEAGLLHVLMEARDDGHSFLPADELIAGGAALLPGLPEPTLPAALQRLGGDRRVIDDGGRCYLPELHYAERNCAAALAMLAEVPASAPDLDAARAIERFETETGLQLAAQQRRAVEMALHEKTSVMVLTGGPGTGKTTIVRAVVSAFGGAKQKVLACAPTGRAARRLAETTAEGAKTIHRLLEFSPLTETFGRDASRPLKGDLLIVDETSMLDLPLAAALLEAVPPGCRLLLVGDVDQLPSVGPGRVLGDVIESATVPVVRLEEVFRQGEQSRIVTNAHRINRGELPASAPPARKGAPLSDFYFVEREDASQAADTICEVVAERIPKAFGLDPVRDVQIIAPMHKGAAGTLRLNEKLQERLNPEGPQLVRGEQTLRLGDRVMQVRNDYDRDVFNGDIGYIVKLDPRAKSLIVEVDGRPVNYDGKGIENLRLSYACSIHKSQGSEYPAVVVPLFTEHFVMLRRKLLYTAVTRGRLLVMLVGSRRALSLAVSNTRERRRHSALEARLKLRTGGQS